MESSQPHDDDPPEEGRPDDEVLPEDAHDDEADEFSPEDFADDPNDIAPRSTMKRVGKGGQLIGAAMIGLAEVLQPRPKQEIPIEIANPGEPPNIDRDGLDEPLGNDGARLKIGRAHV